MSEIKHFIDPNTKIYYITIDKKEVFNIKLDEKLSQVVISTPTEVYAGPVEFISFKEDINGK